MTADMVPALWPAGSATVAAACLLCLSLPLERGSGSWPSARPLSSQHGCWWAALQLLVRVRLLWHLLGRCSPSPPPFLPAFPVFRLGGLLPLHSVLSLLLLWMFCPFLCKC